MALSKREQLLQRYEPSVQELAMRACERVRELVPSSQETVFLGWKTITFGFKKNRICAVAPHKSHVNLQFHRGGELADPEGILEGTGAKMRHVKLHKPADLRRRAVTQLIRAAAEAAR